MNPERPRVLIVGPDGKQTSRAVAYLIGYTITVHRPAYVHEFDANGHRVSVDYGDVIDTTGVVVEDEPLALPEVSG